MGPHVSAPTVAAFAARAEELGYDSLWVQDHFASPLDPNRAPDYNTETSDPYPSVLSPMELLAFTAAVTSRCRLGSSVLVGGYYWPAVLAHRVATLDVLSQGRAVVGLGIGWSEEEHQLVGVNMKTRARRFDDLVPALKACWGADPVSYEGEFFSIPPSVLKPKPYRRARPQLLLGAGVKGLHRSDEFDGWTIGGRIPIAEAAQIAAETNSRRPSHLAPLTVHYRLFTDYPGDVVSADGDVDRLVDMVDQAREAGFEEVIIDASWGPEMSSEQAWLDVPDRLAAVLRD